MTPPEWDAGLCSAATPAPLLQSWGFGETQAREGWEVERVLLPGAGQATVLLQGRRPLRLGYVPRGPVPATEASLRALADWARCRSLVRLRVEPEAGNRLAATLTGLGFQPASSMHPQNTLVVPLAAETEMLAAFKPKHRYNVRLALKRGVTVAEGTDVEELRRQAAATAGRQQITTPAMRVYRNRLDLLQWCRVYVARYEGEAVAAILVARFDGRAYYLFGGSTGRHRQVMPTYAVQWEAMQAAWRDGCRDYDLWGVPPEAEPTHPWHGLWQFKTGFGGELVEYCGAWDLVLSPAGNRAASALAAVRTMVRGLRR